MKKHMRRIRMAVIASVACMLLMACNGADKKDDARAKFDVSYDEWVESRGLFDSESFEVTSYKENKGAGNSVEIFIDHPKDVKKGYEALNEMVNAHNAFVDSNPGYFNDFADIKISVLNASKVEAGYYSNIGTTEDAALTGIKQDAKIDYVEFDVTCAAELINEAVFFDYPYVILNVDRGEKNVLDSEDNYRVLECCRNYNTVFIETFKKTPAGDSAAMVARYNDSAKVYTSNALRDFEEISR